MKGIREKIEDSLDVVGEIFPDVKEACTKGFYKIETDRLTEIEEIIRCIKIFVILKDIKKLTGRKQQVLAHYLLDGYSKETKKIVIKELNITDSNLNNINHELRSMGVINSVGYNQSTNEVNRDLLELKNFIVNSKGNYILIKLNNERRV